jgi:protein O-mannosyl-transferase
MAASRWTVWAGIALVAATVAVYAPALRAPFQFDDNSCIPDNASIRVLWPLSVPLHPPAQTPVAGRPVVNYTLALNYALNERLGIDQRPDPEGPNKTVSYHLANLLLHLICGLLLFGVLRRTLRRQTFDAGWAAMADPASLVITGMWLLHPLQSEAILYVVQRTELLVSVCYVGTLYASIRAWDAESTRARLGWYAGAVALCLLGMGSKEVMISAPLMVVLYDVAFRWTSWKQVVTGGRRWFYLALAATSGLLIALMMGGPRSDSVGFGHGVSWYAYLYGQGWAIPRYLRLVVWPNALTFDYGGASHARGSILGLIALAVAGVATLVAWFRADRWGWFAFLGAWFFLLLAPSSSIVPITTEIAAERRIYLALAAVIILIAVGIEAIRRYVVAAAARAGEDRRWAVAVMGRGPQAGVVVVLLVLATATWERGKMYVKTDVLWRDVVRKMPSNPRGYDNLATVLLQQHPPNTAEADSLLHQSVALDSMDVAAWYGLALAALQRDSVHLAEPESLLRRTLRVDSIYVPALMNLEFVESKEGDITGAETLLQRVLAVAPNDRVALARLGVAFQQQGQADRAIPYLERVVAAEPSVPYLIDLGVAYMDAGRLDAAEATFRAVLAHDPTQEVALNRVGAVLLAQGRAADAVPYLESAVQHQPGSGLSLALLSRAYAESGHAADAIAAASYGMARAGNSAETLSALGDAELALGQRDSAIVLYRRALAVQPAYAPPRQALDRLAGGR